MGDQRDEVVDLLDEPTVERVMRLALNDEAAELKEWRHEPLYSPAGGYVYRVSGNAQCGENAVPWTVVLKKPFQSIGLGTPFGGQREAMIYGSGFLETLSGNLVAPKCFGVTNLDDGGHWIWLEWIQSDDVGEWSLDQYAEVARSFGQFNGTFASGTALPDWPWMQGPVQVHEYVAQFAPEPAIVAETIEYWQTDLDLAPNLADRTVELHANRQALLTALDNVPKCMCHGDADRRNLIVRRNELGEREFVAIDWAICGLSVLGDDIHRLVHSAVMFSEVDHTDLLALEKSAFDAYLAGLEDVGWKGDERLVRLGFAASSALQSGIVVLGIVMHLLRDEGWRKIYEEFLRSPFPEIVETMRALLSYQLGLASEAITLISDLGL